MKKAYCWSLLILLSFAFFWMGAACAQQATLTEDASGTGGTTPTDGGGIWDSSSDFWSNGTATNDNFNNGYTVNFNATNTISSAGGTSTLTISSVGVTTTTIGLFANEGVFGGSLGTAASVSGIPKSGSTTFTVTTPTALTAVASKGYNAGGNVIFGASPASNEGAVTLEQGTVVGNMTINATGAPHTFSGNAVGNPQSQSLGVIGPLKLNNSVTVNSAFGVSGNGTVVSAPLMPP
jgi:hypothetical protein